MKPVADQNPGSASRRLEDSFCHPSSIYMYEPFSYQDGWIDGCLAILRPFNSILFISVRWVDDNERLFAVKRISPRAGLALGTARLVGHCLTH